MRGIEPGIDDVDDQVGQNEDRDDEHDDPLGQRVILILNSLDQQAADAVQIEHLLGHDEAADQKGEFDADHGDHRQHRVLQRVAIDDDAVEQPFRARGADIILA